MQKLCAATIAATCMVVMMIPIAYAAAGEAIPQICASRDLSARTLVERHGEAQSLPPHIVAGAFFDVMQARRTCRAGHLEEADDIYVDVIARLIGANP